MNVPLITRRAFLRVAASGVVTLPLMLHTSLMSTASAAEVNCASCLSLLDQALAADLVDGARVLGFASQTLTLDDATHWSEMVDALSGAQGWPIAVLGRPATVFAARVILEPAWRVVFEGHHRRADAITRHSLSGPDVLTTQLSRQVGRIGDPLRYAQVLASMAQPTREFETRAVEFDSQGWPAMDLVSLLAWPRRVA